MDLKALILAKRKATAEEFQGRKYVKRSDLEAARLQKLRDEEEQERQQGKVCALPVHAAHSAAGLKRVPYCLISQEAFNNERLPIRMCNISAAPVLQAHAQREPAQLERRRKSSGEVAADEELSRDEVIRRLRALDQPVTLFGEARLRLCTP